MKHLLQLREAIAAQYGLLPNGGATVSPEVIAQVNEAAQADGLREGRSSGLSFVSAVYEWNTPDDGRPLVSVNPDDNWVHFTYWLNRRATR